MCNKGNFFYDLISNQIFKLLFYIKSFVLYKKKLSVLQETDIYEIVFAKEKTTSNGIRLKSLAELSYTYIYIWVCFIFHEIYVYKPEASSTKIYLFFFKYWSLFFFLRIWKLKMQRLLCGIKFPEHSKTKK